MSSAPAARALAEPVATAATVTPLHAAPAWRQRLAGHLAWNLVSDASMRGASLWMAFWCARALPVAGFGRYAFALAIAQYAWLAGDAAANGGYSTRELLRARHLHDPAAAALGGVLWRARLGAALVLSLLAVPALLLWHAPLELRMATAGAALFFCTFAAFPDWALRAAEDFRGLALANLAGATALVAGTALLLPRWPHPYVAAAIWALSFAVAAAVAIPRLWLRGVIDPLAPGAWRPHARRSFVYSIGAIAGIGCVQTPMLLVGALASPEANGLFAASYRLLLAVLSAFSVLWWPLFPLLARSEPRSATYRDAVASLAGVVLLLSLPATLAFTLWSRELLALLYGARYVGGAAALQVGALALPLFATSALLEQACLALDGEVARLRIYGGALAVMVTTAAILVPRIGPTGAAVGLLAGFVCSVTAFAWALRAVLPFAAMLARMRAAALLAAALAGAWLLARALHAPAVPALVAGVLAYGASALALRMVPLPHWSRRAA